MVSQVQTTLKTAMFIHIDSEVYKETFYLVSSGNYSKFIMAIKRHSLALESNHQLNKLPVN